jgi:hypothetical protein
LNPLKVGDRHHPHQQVCKTGDVVTLTLHTAVQAFVERARLCLMGCLPRE